MNAFPFPAPPPSPEPSLGPRPMPGAGTLLSATAEGYSISAAPAKGARFRHPWRPTFTGRAVKLSLGLVEGRAATIGGVRMDGDAQHPQPELALKPGVANAEGESWICVEVEPDKTGALTRDSRREIVHRGEPRSIVPEVGRCALVLLLWRQGRVWRSVQIIHYHVGYERVMPPEGSGVVRHLFP